MSQHVEINDAVDCDIYIGASARVAPDEHHSRTCPQCQRTTWAATAACMWCGHDRLSRPLRWLIALACLAALAVNIPIGVLHG